MIFFAKRKKKNKKLKKRVFINNFSKLNVSRKIPEKFYFKFAWLSLFWVGFADLMKDKAILPENVDPEDAYTDEYSLK